MENFETVEIKTDVLIVGGGMAACGAYLCSHHFSPPFLGKLFKCYSCNNY